MMTRITTRSGARYDIDEDTLEVVRLAEHPVVDAADDKTPMPAPCSMKGKLINDLDYMRVAEHVLFRCACCGTSVKLTRIVKEESCSDA